MRKKPHQLYIVLKTNRTRLKITLYIICSNIHNVISRTRHVRNTKTMRYRTITCVIINYIVSLINVRAEISVNPRSLSHCRRYQTKCFHYCSAKFTRPSYSLNAYDFTVFRQRVHTDVGDK